MHTPYAIQNKTFKASAYFIGLVISAIANPPLVAVKLVIRQFRSESYSKRQSAPVS